SEVGAYESDAASLFVKIGADVGLVASERDEETRVSSRSRSGTASETDLHLGELMSEVADKFGGSGGGHAGAAAMTVEVPLEEIKETLLEEVKEMLQSGD
ncbi:MAG: DHHA1 domain-containing protein, partial [Candidatus Aenigmatarchaeota archaeon]